MYFRGISAGLAFFLIVASTPATPFPEDDASFAGIAWGSAIESESEFTEVGRAPDVVKYTRRPPGSTLEGVAIQSIEYWFFRGRFYSAIVRFIPAHTFDELAALIEKRFGAPEITENEGTRLASLQSGDLAINLTYSAERGEGALVFIHSPLAQDFFEEARARQRSVTEGHDDAEHIPEEQSHGGK